MEPTLHPNLAKLAAAYDEIIRRLDLGQIQPQQARSEIAQLEARDDEGIRWSIDPDSGEWIRKTASGDSEYDPSPPTSGFMTPDAFDYTHDPKAFNPANMVHIAPVDSSLEQRPTALTGATRTASAQGKRRNSAVAGLLKQVSDLSMRVKVLVVVLLVMVLALAIHGTSATPDPTPTPTPTVAVRPTPPPVKKVVPPPVKKVHKKR